MMWRAWLLCPSILLLSNAALAQQTPAANSVSGPTAVAVLAFVDGHVEYVHDGERKTLTGQPFVPLYPNDSLTCQTGKSFTMITATMSPLKIEQCDKRPYVVQALPAARALPNIAAPAAENYAPILARYGRPGGRSRGSMTGLLIWPVDGVRTRASTASHLQWRKQAGGVLTAELRDTGSGRVLWTRSAIDATLGSLDDGDLESALRELADAHGPAPVLELRLSNAQSASATVNLLDGTNEQALQRQLGVMTAGLTDEPLHLVRADLLLQAGLPREALEEYLAVLETAPEAATILQKAADLASEVSDPRTSALVRRARAAQQ
jgi:hypothetical protein